MCAVSIFLIASGAVTGVIAATNVISPSLGHRDMLDRVGIGVADIAKEIITVVTRQTPEQQDSIIEFCEDFYPADEVDQCILEVSQPRERTRAGKPAVGLIGEGAPDHT